MLLIVAMGCSLLAEALGMHFVLGAFMGGLFYIRRTLPDRVYEDVRKRISTITTGFLAPVFFASIGLNLDLGALRAVPSYLLLLLSATGRSVHA